MVSSLYRCLKGLLTSVKRNVLHLIPSFHSGGSERQAIQLVRLLSSEGRHNVLVACLNKDGPLIEEFGREAVDEIPEFALDSFYDGKMARQLFSFVRFLKREKIEIVQCHDFYTNIFGMLGAWIARVPIRIAAKRETGMRSRAQLFVERRAMGLATAVVANSLSVKEFLTELGVPAGKIEVIHNGLDLSRFSARPTDRAVVFEEFGLPSDPKLKLVTIVANLRDPVKDQETFLKAAAVVAKRHPTAIFVLAGEGPRIDALRDVANSLGISEKTFLIGRCDRVPELLSLSSVGVLTSTSEGFANSIIEYMAAGLPVVATKVGGTAEAIIEGETGFLVDVGDSATIARRVNEILDNDERACEMGRRGAERVEIEFSAEAQLAKTNALYEKEFRRLHS